MTRFGKPLEDRFRFEWKILCSLEENDGSIMTAHKSSHQHSVASSTWLFTQAEEVSAVMVACGYCTRG